MSSLVISRRPAASCSLPAHGNLSYTCTGASRSATRGRPIDRQQRINGTGGSPWQLGSRRRQASFPRWSVWCILYIPWFWTWGLPPATGRASEEVDRRPWRPAGMVERDEGDPLRPNHETWSWPSWQCCGVGWEGWDGGMDDNAPRDRLLLVAVGPCLVEIWGEPRDGFVKGRGQ